MGASNFAGLALPKGEPHRRTRARADRLQARNDKAVYAAVDARDGHRCRICGDYMGYEIQRAHIIARSLGGETTTQNVFHLCANCHLVGQHGGYLRLSGNADTRNQFGALCGVKVERLISTGAGGHPNRSVWVSEGYR